MPRTRFAIAVICLFTLTATSTAADDSEDAGFVEFKGASFPVKEEDGEVKIKVRRHRGEAGVVSVDYATSDGTAVAGEDYEAVSGTLTWEDDDDDDKRFTVPILDDLDPEGGETFHITLSNPTGGVELGSVSMTVVRIKPSDQSDDDDDDDDDDGEDDDDDGEDDDEGGSAGVIKLTAASFPAIEGSGEAIFEVERSGGESGAVSVDFTTVDGSALADEDYLTLQGTLSWADGEDGTQSVTVTVLDDSEAEPIETVSVVLTNATGGATLGVRDVASILIVDDDGGGGTCIPDETTLCLREGRFQIVGSWLKADGSTGPFHAIPVTDQSGLIWFFNESNLEMLVKVIDGCPLNGHFWVFYAGLTNVGFTMEVSDLEAGASRVYENPVGVVPLVNTDVSAFATCP